MIGHPMADSRVRRLGEVDGYVFSIGRLVAIPMRQCEYRDMKGVDTQPPELSQCPLDEETGQLRAPMSNKTHAAIAADAAKMAGTDLDLDRDLVSAAIEHLTKAESELR